MNRPLKAYAREAFLIPIRTLSADDIENAHARCLIRIYDDKKCSVCENYDDRHSDVCDSCAAFLSARQMSKLVEDGGKTFLSIPLGARKILKNWATTIGREVTVVEHFPDADSFSRPIRFTGKLYGYQEEAVQAIMDRKRGMLKSPPRSGKTVIATAAICRIGQKAIVIASQIEWLNQFRDTFLGSESTDAMTNARESQVRICKTYDDFLEADVCLATFSTFFSKNGKRLLERIKDLAGIVIMDECFPGDHEVLTDVGWVRIDRVVARLLRGEDIHVRSMSSQGEMRTSKAKSPITKTVTELMEVELSTGQVIRCTPNHPFWSETRGRYVRADELKEQEVLIESPRI